MYAETASNAYWTSSGADIYRVGAAVGITGSLILNKTSAYTTPLFIYNLPQNESYTKQVVVGGIGDITVSWRTGSVDSASYAENATSASHLNSDMGGINDE